jgi:hypothetical protein
MTSKPDIFITTKLCPSCNLPKNSSKEFSNNAKNPDGKQLYCKQCKREQYLVAKQLKNKLPDASQITVSLRTKNYDTIIANPAIKAYSTFSIQVLKSQTALNLRRLVSTKQPRLQEKYLANATLYLLAMANKTSIRTAKVALTSAITSQPIFAKTTKQSQLNKILPHIRACLENARSNNINPEPETAENIEPAANTKIVPITPTTDSTPPTNPAWCPGTVVLMRGKTGIMPITIQSVSHNQKCFQGNDGTWYEINKAEVIDFASQA